MRTFIVLATLALFTGAAPAAAQTFGFGAHAGVSLPTGEYGDFADTGFSGGLDLWYPLSNVVPGLSWYTSVDAVGHSSAAENSDGGFLYVPAMTGVRFDVPIGPVAAFATGQLGAVFSRASDFGVGNAVLDDSDWGTDFGFAVGGGLQLTNNVYAGLKYYPLGGTDFEFDGIATPAELDVSFLDIYIGFGVR